MFRRVPAVSVHVPAMMMEHLMSFTVTLMYGAGAAGTSAELIYLIMKCEDGERTEEHEALTHGTYTHLSLSLVEMINRFLRHS